MHYYHDDPLDGIFVYLNRYHPTFFDIEASTVSWLTDVEPRDITNRNRSGSSLYWATNYELDMIISFKRPIFLTSYTIENAAGHSWMMNWTVFGTNHKKQWDKIDERKGEIFCDNPSTSDNGLRCSPNTNKTYFIQNPKFFNSIKIRNEKNTINENYIIMRSLEFHGLVTFSPLVSVLRKVTAPHLISCIAILLS